jgi:uncharacterized phage protein (TIGR02216 family)
MHAALSLLRWTPHAFWRATPRELALALAPRRQRNPLNGADLDGLMQLFPDNA